MLSSLSFALPPYYNALADAMSKIFDDDFDSAIFICDSLSEQYPDDPSPAVFKIIAKSSRLQDVENDAGFDSLRVQIDSVETKCIRKWGENPKNLWGAFTIANLYGQSAVLSFIGGKRNFISAWKLASKAKKLWQYASKDSLLAIESGNGLGNYYYWISAKAGIIRSIGFIEDKRDTAVVMLKTASRKGILSRDSALHSLVFILLDYGDTAGAKSAVDELLARHPNSRTAHWDKLILRLATRNWKQVKPIADTLMKYYNGKSDYNMCQLSLSAAYSQFQLGDTMNCCKYFVLFNS
ncbi:hypothetical protein J7L68_00190, partial [bacterium]|nr:hypothetical protein [bacterium]